MRILGIIPARYSSTRFPGKPLVLIHGKTMIHRVFERAMQTSALDDLIVATDDERIVAEVNRFDGKVMLTSPFHLNGTERCHEVVTKMPEPYDIVVNIQGDEPFIEPHQIELLVNCFTNPKTEIATLIKQCEDEEELRSSSVIKVVVNKELEAMYFSRSSIPFVRAKQDGHSFFKHIGLYAYRAETLAELVKLAPTILEQTESLEQLRWMENGYRIHTAITTHDSISIDTPADLERALRH